MKIISKIYNIFLDALFPISSSEKELFSFTKEQAYEKLPEAPSSPMPHMYSVFAYKDERVTKLVWNIKYKRSEWAVSIGGYALYQELLEFKKDLLRSPSPFQGEGWGEVLNHPSIPSLKRRGGMRTILIPIPISLRRRRERGYNQCELLTAEIERLDSTSQFRVINDLLERTQHISRQTLKHRQERLLNTRNIFSLNEKVLQKLKTEWPEFFNINIVIIDDVITTGSTMNEAILTLKNAGFTNVSGLSLAH